MFEGEVCFITGGAQGIGLGIAAACARHGAKIAIADVDTHALQNARRQLDPLADVRTYVLDVTDRAACTAVAATVESELGPVRALFNNAGVADSISPSRMTGEVWDWILAVNVNGVFNCIQAFLPRMLERGPGGFITNTASMAGLVSGDTGFAYAASKHAVVGLSTSLRTELARRDINVSVVCPGQVATSIMANTRGLRPDGAQAHTERTLQALAEAEKGLHESGTSAEAAGRIIVEGTLAKIPYIFTDAQWRSAIEAQHREVLDSLAMCFPHEVGAS